MKVNHFPQYGVFDCYPDERLAFPTSVLSKREERRPSLVQQTFSPISLLPHCHTIFVIYRSNHNQEIQLLDKTAFLAELCDLYNLLALLVELIHTDSLTLSIFCLLLLRDRLLTLNQSPLPDNPRCIGFPRFHRLQTYTIAILSFSAFLDVASAGSICRQTEWPAVGSASTPVPQMQRVQRSPNGRNFGRHTRGVCRHA